MKDERQLVADEWLQFAKDDLESAKIILKESDNYHITVYHTHQSIEKLFKWFLLKNKQRFPFIHDLKELFRSINNIKKLSLQFDDITYIDDFYPQLRYPTGENITKEEAEKSLIIVEKVFKELTI
ncbi:HEPN domain-containing protein [Candidatus Saganbacteria bacterium]|nr:HEPN domain-containing protein [Candidatus Saganbacteria bacterium]